MRKLLGIASLGLLALAAVPTESRAQEYPWCAQYGWYTRSCGFVSQAQCMATVQGVGGGCYLNPSYVAAQPGRKGRKHRSG